MDRGHLKCLKAVYRQDAVKARFIPNTFLNSYYQNSHFGNLKNAIFSLNFELTWNEKCDLFLFGFKKKNIFGKIFCCLKCKTIFQFF